MEQADDVLKPYYKTIRSLLNLRNEKDMRVCHKSMAHPFRFFSFFQIRN